MKRSALILLFAVLFSSVFYAQKKFDIDASLRLRSTIDDRSFNKNNDALSYTEMRTRLGVSFFGGNGVSAFVQAQDSRIFGQEAGTISNSKNLDLHQGYLKIENFFGAPLEMKAGRMEVAYANERLIGSVGWSNIGRSFDGGIFRFSCEKNYIDAFGFAINERLAAGDVDDAYLFGIWGAVNSIEGYTIQPFILLSKQVATKENDLYTIGFYEKGSSSNLTHELEFAYQTGKTEKNVFTSVTSNEDVSAFMAALNFSYALKGELNPVLSAGVDYLSGDKDYSDGKMKAFNTLYATNHKFYGYMDYFVSLPNDTYLRGLIDLHLGAAFQFTKKLNFSVKYHNFSAAQKAETLAKTNDSKTFGNEIDFTAVYKYNDNYFIQGGFSLFFTGDYLNIDNPTTSWAYLMGTVAF